MIQVTESDDLEYFAELAGIEPGTLKAHEAVTYWLVSYGEKKRGGFVTIRKSPSTVELHSELRIGGIAALNAIRQLCQLLRERGFEQISSYIPHDNYLTRFAANVAGFSLRGRDSEFGYYEKQLCYQS